MTIDRLILVLNAFIFFLIWVPIIIDIIRKRKNKLDTQDTKHWTIEKAMQQVKDGEKPLFIGFSLTVEQYEELLPYINDSDYLAIIQSRVEAE